MNKQTNIKKRISVSIVTYNSSKDIDQLMNSIENSAAFNEMSVYVVDNNSIDNTVDHIKKNYPWANVIISNKNLGFGKGHNKVIKHVKSQYHIIVNPDISFDINTISNAVEYMDSNETVALLSPAVYNADGTWQYLPKRNPRFKYLFGGMFERKFKFCKRLRDEYTMKNKKFDSPTDIEFCTGAFMVTRTNALKKVGGFDKRYFLHFEDADLSREMRKVGRTVLNPNIRVTHKWHRDNRKLNKSFWVAFESMILYMLKWNL